MAYTTIDDPTIYFNTKIFTGNNSANNSITGVGFQPDWIWFKNRNAANDHALVDSVRGRKALSSNNTSAELTLNPDKDFQSFDSDGFTVDVVEQLNSFNKSGDSIVTWNWKAGGSASSNTDGSITSSVSANTTAGFSIVSFTGTGSNATVGHGLGTAPSMVIIRRRDSGNDWRIGSNALTSWTKHINLNTTAAESDLAVAFNSTAPTSSVFSVGTSPSTNASSGTFIAYCFTSTKGYSKIGRYTGNGSTDGTFIYTGFRVGWVMIKRTDGANGWYIYDSTRDPENQNTKALLPAETDAEQDESGMDLLSNGFKLRNTDGSKNGSGNSYIYMAFAENPFVTSGGIPATAR